jgi:hypothetical protein
MLHKQFLRIASVNTVPAKSLLRRQLGQSRQLRVESYWELREISCGTGRTQAWEAEEFPLLEAVARERLLMTQQAAEESAFAAVIYKVWRLEMAL